MMENLQLLHDRTFMNQSTGINYGRAKAHQFHGYLPNSMTYTIEYVRTEYILNLDFQIGIPHCTVFSFSRGELCGDRFFRNEIKHSTHIPGPIP